jgi:hypothetical protein
MSDPRNDSSRMTEPKKGNTMVYVIGGLLLAAIVAYFLMSGGVDRSAIPATSEAPAATETPAPATPAPAEPAPAATAPAEPAPAATPPATTPVAPANP